MKLTNYIGVIIFLILMGCNSSKLKEKKIFFKNGNLKEKYFVDKKNRKQGLSYQYYPNGELEIKAKFKNNIQVDTSFNYLDNGHLNVVVIYDSKGLKMKEIGLFSNQKTHIIQSYFVDGGGRISAYREYFENGMLNESASDFAALEFYGEDKDSIRVKLYNCSFSDSVRVNIIQSFNFEYSFDARVIRTMKFSKTKNLKFKLLKSDFIKNKVNIQILTEKWESSKLKKVNSYPIQISKGTFPKDNVEGIYKVY